VQFSRPVFPTQIWLIAPAAAALDPIDPSGDAMVDIRTTCRLLSGLSVLAKPNTCLDPGLYDLAGQGAEVRPFHDSLKFMAPAVLDGQAEATILDVPDALVALRRYPGRIKVLGPISIPQHMAAAFPPQSTALCVAYDRFLAELRADGTYDTLVDRYYPAVRRYYPTFFAAEVATP
jgi:ABC-type amino acid transport substrate-binding protein